MQNHKLSAQFQLRVEVAGMPKPAWAAKHHSAIPDVSLLLVASATDAFEEAVIYDGVRSQRTGRVVIVKDNWIKLSELRLKPSLIVGTERDNIADVAEVLAALVVPKPLLVGMAFGDVLQLAGADDGVAEGRAIVYEGCISPLLVAKIESDIQMLARAGWSRGMLIVQLAAKKEFRRIDLRETHDFIKQATQRFKSSTLWTIAPSTSKSQVVAIVFHDLVEFP